MAGMIVVAECQGCGLVKKENGLETCKIWASPYAKHKPLGGCPSKTNKVKEVKEAKFINPLKASKRS